MNFKLKSIMLAAFSFVSALAQQSLTPVQRYGQLQVDGVSIKSTITNTPVQLRGMSFFWSQWADGARFYKTEVVNEFIDDWKVNVLRAAMGINESNTGYYFNPTAEKQKIYTVVDAAIAKGIYVIVDWHSHNAQNQLDSSKKFFAELAQKYGNYPNIIYEVYNEPLEVSWPNVIKPYCQAVIDTIRVHDPDNLVICGTRSWSQRVDDVVSSKINDPNVAYTLHYYAATHKASLRAIAQTAINGGVPLFVTEFGTCEASGAGKIDFAESNVWWDFLEANHISWCNWSISDKDEAASALKPGVSLLGNWNKTNYTTSGAFVRNKLRWEYDYQKFDNDLEIKVAPGYEVLYTDTTFKFNVSLFNNGQEVDKDSVTYTFEVSNGGLVDDTGLFTPDGSSGLFRLFITAQTDTLKSSTHVDFILTDVLPTAITNTSDKTMLALTLNGNYKLDKTFRIPVALDTLVPSIDASYLVNDSTYTWKVINEYEGVLSVADSAVKSYLAIYVTNPIERSALMSQNKMGNSKVYLNGSLVSTSAFTLLKGENLLVIEYTGVVDTSYFDFLITDLQGDTLKNLSYSTSGSGFFDCNKTWKGVARIDAECGCIGGTTGLVRCSGPYLGYPAPIPGKILAVNYDFGRAGEAYNDASPVNNGNSTYREPDPVDIYGSNDQGSTATLGYIEPGEWLKYTVEVADSANYLTEIRVATAMAGGQFQLKIDGVYLFSKNISVPNTGNWGTWTTITSDTFHLAKGVHTLMWENKAGYYNINYFNFKKAPIVKVYDEMLPNTSVYPNPFVSNFNLQSANSTHYAIYSVQGVNLEEGHCADNCNLGELLPKGIYVLELTQGQKRSIQRIVKN